MDHPAEHMIEATVLGRNPNAPEHAEVRDHLHNCPACRAVADFLQKMHADIASSPETPGRKVLSFIESLTPRAQVIRLRPFEQVHPVQTNPNQPIVLAAHSIATKPRFQNVATLVSDDEATLLRVVFDSAENILRLSLQTSNQVERGDILINIPEWQVTCVTDDRGQADVHAVVPGDGFQQINAIACVPIAVFDIKVDLVAREMSVTSPAGVAKGIHCSLAESIIEISFVDSENPPSASRMVVMAGGRMLGLFDLTARPAAIPLPEIYTSLHILLYA